MNKITSTPLDRVLAEMKRLKLNNQQMAIRLGVSKAVWNNWKNRGIPESAYATVAARLSWSTDYLIYGKETPEMATPPGIDVDVMTSVIAFIEAWLDEQNLKAPTAQKAEIIATLYELQMRSEKHPDRKQIDKQTFGPILKLVVSNR